MNNPHKSSDALKFLQSIIPDTKEMRVLGEQEAMRIELTQVLRDARKACLMSNEEIAAAIDKDVEWVQRTEDCNYVHTWDEFVAYLHGLNPSFEITVSLSNGQTIKLDSAQIKRLAQ